MENTVKLQESSCIWKSSELLHTFTEKRHSNVKMLHILSTFIMPDNFQIPFILFELCHLVRRSQKMHFSHFNIGADGTECWLLEWRLQLSEWRAASTHLSSTRWLHHNIHHSHVICTSKRRKNCALSNSAGVVEIGLVHSTLRAFQWQKYHKRPHWLLC